MGDHVMATIGMPPPETAAAGTSVQTFGHPPAPGTADEPDMVVTPSQHAFLDALTDADVTPSSELSALSIGSYVCQARAARQSDQAVWEFVLPMVRGDVRDSHREHHESAAPPAGQVNSETADYIRIATQTLC